MSDIDYFVEIAYIFSHFRQDIIHSAIEALQLPAGSRGLDAGCSLGLQAMQLAGAIGPAGHVTGLDLSPEILVYAEDVVKKAGMSERVSFREGDVSKLPFDDDSFDWAWSMDCVGYLPLEPVPLLAELTRVVKPGGRVALLAWSSEKILPGYPLLEARLNATSGGIAPFVKGTKPESHFLRALGWFREAGLEEPVVQTFAGGAYAPLADDQYRALEALFQMRWPGVEDVLTQEDWKEYRRLCLPKSADYILNQPDYYAFFTYSMFSGLKKRIKEK
jgi:demethylmenaquinone methyltransferase/2-methoxy-6-polyprenyl-1,4-benzoquinol methylase